MPINSDPNEKPLTKSEILLSQVILAVILTGIALGVHYGIESLFTKLGRILAG